MASVTKVSGGKTAAHPDQVAEAGTSGALRLLLTEREAGASAPDARDSLPLLHHERAEVQLTARQLSAIPTTAATRRT